ncbi:MAG: hypothetical protein B7Y75_02445 [Azorhizobium sp. 35-67-5]|nr:MAG: hypothetical protein B7Y75_02445 [Azorhizobium sp. 35-67-5]
MRPVRAESDTETEMPPAGPRSLSKRVPNTVSPRLDCVQISSVSGGLLQSAGTASPTAPRSVL